MEVQSPGAPSVVPQNSSTSSSIPSSSEVSSLPTSISPMNLENLDKECSALAGLFQQTVNDMKVGLLNPKNLFYSKLYTRYLSLILCTLNTVLIKQLN